MPWFRKKHHNNQQNNIEKVTCTNCYQTFDPFDIFVTTEGKSLCKKKCAVKQK